MRPFGRRCLVGFCLTGLVGLLGCSGEDVQHGDPPPQQWNGWEVQVEARPSPPRNGMNEFLVLMTGKHDHPVASCLVDVRTAQFDEWSQAIQDGLVGVYRRAALLAPGERHTLQVRLRCGDDKSMNTVLYFPIHVVP